MLDLSNVSHHSTVDELSEVLCTRTGRDAPEFFRTLTTYYLASMASCMRAVVHSPVLSGEIPINEYVIALAPSGFGKGKSTNCLENEVFTDFRQTFKDFTLPAISEDSLWRRAIREAALTGNDEDVEYKRLKAEYDTRGEYPFVFDGGSEPAVKQVREKLLLAGAGALNLQIDEIGTNLEKQGSTESLATYLELYDLGRIKQKLKMNTADNKRMKEIEGSTPANMLLFGTQDTLLDGGSLEKRFTTMLQTGYARRCMFAWADVTTVVEQEHNDDDFDKIYERLVNPANDAAIQKWRNHFASLADANKLGWTVTVPENVDKMILQYQLECQQNAQKLSEFDHIRRAEMTHRYFRAVKLAGVYAFVEESLTMTMNHLMAAIKLTEESGASFAKLMSREPPHAKLARFLVSAEVPKNHADLYGDLPFFKAASKADRQDMLTMATGWGYTQHMMIKHHYDLGIQFWTGDSLKQVDLDGLSLAHSDHFAYNYVSDSAPLDQLSNLLTMKDYNWTAHSFTGGHRHGDNLIPGFELAVFDIDGSASRHIVHELMEKYVFVTHTTKRHTPEHNRFRLIIPLNYRLELNQDDYQEFMSNLIQWLPFRVDEAASKDITRKWATFEHSNVHIHSDGQLLDVLPFVPRTIKNEEHQKEIKELGSLDALERWFAQRIATGDRNNQMIRFAFALADSGMSYHQIETKVLAFNGKLANKLSETELQSTVLVTIAKRLQATTV